MTFAGEATFTWTKDRNQTEHRIELRYSSEKAGGDSNWIEDDDLIEYRGVYRRYFGPITFAYGAAGLDSVFTGPEPDEYALQPTDVRISAGLGQIRKWGEWKILSNIVVASGPRIPLATTTSSKSGNRMPKSVPRACCITFRAERQVSFYVRFEAFTPFDDMANVEFLLTSGFTYKLLEYVSLDLYFRGYYEGQPEDAPDDAPGYDEVSYRNGLLLGVTYSF